MSSNMLSYSMMDIKAIRAKLGLTQQEFAYRLGVALPTVARWEAGGKPSKLAQRAIERLVKGVK